MLNLLTQGSNDKPEINFNYDTGILSIGGSSLPENVMEIYGPVLKWIENYCENPKKHTIINFYFDYLNTSSSHMIMRILEKILNLRNNCELLEINWLFHTEDVEMMQFGQELAELSNYPINIKER